MGPMPLIEALGARELLHRIWAQYCGTGGAHPSATVSSRKLHKLFKDLKFYDRNLRTEHLDIIFLHAAANRPLEGWYKSRDEVVLTKNADKTPKYLGKAGINFEQFVVALASAVRPFKKPGADTVRQMPGFLVK